MKVEVLELEKFKKKLKSQEMRFPKSKTTAADNTSTNTAKTCCLHFSCLSQKSSTILVNPLLINEIVSAEGFVQKNQLFSLKPCPLNVACTTQELLHALVDPLLDKSVQKSFRLGHYFKMCNFARVPFC